MRRVRRFKQKRWKAPLLIGNVKVWKPGAGQVSDSWRCREDNAVSLSRTYSCYWWRGQIRSISNTSHPGEQRRRCSFPHRRKTRVTLLLLCPLSHTASQYDQTIFAVKPHSRAVATFRIKNRICIYRITLITLETLYWLCVWMAAQLRAHVKKLLLSVKIILEGTL